MKAIIAAFILLLAWQSGVYADGDMPPESLFLEDDLLLEEEPELFTATKFSISMRRAPAIATIITDEEIRDSGARDLSDVLNMVPGMAVHRNRLGDKTIEIRGIHSFNSEKLLIMINGHRLNNPLLGSATRLFATLPVDNIRRIEVVRGPGSALYGANAFGGVVNIFTKEAIDTYGLKVTAGAGSFDTRRFNLLFGEETDLFSVSASLSGITTDGDKLMVEADAATAIDNAVPFPPASMAPGKTDDWRDQYDFSLNLRAGDFRFDFHHTQKKDGPYVGVAFALNDESIEKYEQTYGHLQYRKVVTSNLTLTANAYADRLEHDQYWEIFPEGFFGAFPDGMLGHPIAKNRIFGTELQLDYLMDNHFFTLGAAYEDVKQYGVKHYANFDPSILSPPTPLPGGYQDITDTLNFNRNTKRQVWAVYIQDSWSIRDDLDITLGVRHDNYDDTGSTTNPRLGMVWGFSQNGELKLLYGTAFRAPNFEELYNDNNPAVVGNPELKPEKIKTYEASLSHRFENGISATITYFRNEIKELISLEPDPMVPGGSKYENKGSINTNGLEAEIKIHKHNFYAYANYSFQNSIDKSTGDRIPFTATHRGNIGFNYGLNAYINFNTNMGVVGERPREVGDPRNDLSSHALLDAAVLLSGLVKNATFKVSGHNLLDKEYQDPVAVADQVPGGFPREGRSIMVEASYYFK